MSRHRRTEMPEVVRANLRALRRRARGQARATISELVQQVASHVQVRAGTQALPTLAVQVDGTARHLHSTVDPVDEARTWADHMEESQPDWQIGLVLGFGLGYHVEELIRRYPDRILLVAEPDPAVFQAALTTRNLEGLLGHANLMLHAGNDPIQAAGVLFQTLRSRIRGRSLAVLAWPPTHRLWPDYWAALQQEMWSQANADTVNLATYRSLAYLWLHNIFANLPTSVADPGVGSLFGRFAGYPAILVSAGPSLDRNVEALREAQGRALIVAVLQAVRTLQRHGIVPDLVVSFDPKEANYAKHFAGLDTREIFLVYAEMLVPRILAEHPGPRFVMGLDIHPLPRWIHEHLGVEKGTVRSGPSVANTAFDLLLRLECDPIILVGQDLAFTGNRTHATDVGGGGAISSELLARVEESPGEYAWVEDIHGQRLLTNRAMLGMKAWFEETLDVLGGRYRVIDATEGGAYIRGTQVQRLAQALDQHCPEPFQPRQMLDTVHAEESGRLQGMDLAASLGRLWGELYRELDEVQRLALEAGKVLRGLDRALEAQELSQRKFERFYRRIRGLDRSMSRLEMANQVLPVAIRHQVDAVNRLAQEFLSEPDLAARARYFIEIYTGLFHAAGEAAATIQGMLGDLGYISSSDGAGA